MNHGTFRSPVTPVMLSLPFPSWWARLENLGGSGQNPLKFANCSKFKQESTMWERRLGGQFLECCGLGPFKKNTIKKSLSTPTPSFKRKNKLKGTVYWGRGELHKSFYFMLHHLHSMRFNDTSWLGLILSQQEHHIPYCHRKFHFSPSLMGDYCNVKPWDLNNTSRFYYEEKGLYFGVFLLQRSPDTKPWITWNNGLTDQPFATFFRKKTTFLD